MIFTVGCEEFYGLCCSRVPPQYHTLIEQVSHQIWVKSVIPANAKSSVICRHHPSRISYFVEVVDPCHPKCPGIFRAIKTRSLLQVLCSLECCVLWFIICPKIYKNFYKQSNAEYYSITLSTLHLCTENTLLREEGNSQG